MHCQTVCNVNGLASHRDTEVPSTIVKQTYIHPTVLSAFNTIIYLELYYNRQIKISPLFGFVTSEITNGAGHGHTTSSLHLRGDQRAVDADAHFEASVQAAARPEVGGRQEHAGADRAAPRPVRELHPPDPLELRQRHVHVLAETFTRPVTAGDAAGSPLVPG